MKLPSFKRFFATDFKPEFRELVASLSNIVNTSFEVLYNALSRRLTFEDNFQCTVKDIIVVVDPSGFPTTRTAFTLDLQGQVGGLILTRVENLTNSTNYPTSGVTISFTQIQTGVLIDNITGLQANQSYRIRVVALIS